MDRLDTSKIRELYDQARHVYKADRIRKCNQCNIIKQERDEDVDKIDDTNGKINPYHEIIVNKAERDDTIILQMEQWSILSNVVNYVQ